MSFLDYPPLEGDKLELFTNPRRWEDFVQIVIEITLLAYQNLYLERVAEQTWEEDRFTLNLERCIRPLALTRGIFVLSQTKFYTPEMEKGDTSLKEAKILDLRIWGIWKDYDKIHFVWEGKRIADRAAYAEFKDLVPEYIKEGIFRFIDDEYAPGVDDAGMLAYVLGGDIPTIVLDINKSMESSRRLRRLSTADHLYPAPSIGTVTRIYLSYHQRSGALQAIRLYHLFLTFDFTAKSETAASAYLTS